MIFGFGKVTWKFPLLMSFKPSSTMTLCIPKKSSHAFSWPFFSFVLKRKTMLTLRKRLKKHWRESSGIAENAKNVQNCKAVKNIQKAEPTYSDDKTNARRFEIKEGSIHYFLLRNTRVQISYMLLSSKIWLHLGRGSKEASIQHLIKLKEGLASWPFLLVFLSSSKCRPHLCYSFHSG